MLSAEEALRGPVILNEEGKFNASIIEMTKTLCNATYEQRVLSAFTDISVSLSMTRPKRDITSVATAIGAVANVIIGVTDFLRGISEPTNPSQRIEVVKILAGQIDRNLRNSLMDHSLMNREEEREIEIISASSRHHLGLIREEVNHIPMIVWSGYHVVHELYAGAANTKVIKNQCSRGQFATYELGELLENRELSDMMPEHTVESACAI